MDKASLSSVGSVPGSKPLYLRGRPEVHTLLPSGPSRCPDRKPRRTRTS